MSEDQPMVPGDPQPTSAAEYLARFKCNQRISGYGLNVTVHYPCPFCAAPDFKVEKVLDTERNAGKESVCKECGRGMAVLLTKSEDGLQSMMSMVQTSGPDQPDWMYPKMQRAALAPTVPLPAPQSPSDTRPTCAHEGDPRMFPDWIHFEVRKGDPGMRCTYCGSSHPQEVARAIRAGARLELADRKYGWPHKAYIHAPAAGYGYTKPEDIRDPAGLFKFYTVHLQDASPEDKDTIEQALGISIDFQGSKVFWRPYSKL